MFHFLNVTKMKKKDLLILMATAVLTSAGLTSCTNEAETTGSGQELQEKSSVTFKISLPTGDPVHYKTRALQDGNEYQFTKLMMLVYDAKDEKLIDKQDITLPDPLGPSTNPTEASASGNDYQYTYTAAMADGTLARRFVFVANDACSDANLTVNTSTYTNLSSALAAQAIAAELQSSTFTSGYLPMSGEATTNGSPIINMSRTADVQAEVTLTRIVARIDVKNNVPNLEITDLKIINANPNGYIKQHGTAGAASPNGIAIPSAMTKINGVQPYNTIASLTSAEYCETGKFMPLQSALEPGTGNVLTPAHFKKAFYVYEDVDNATDGVLTLLVQGKLSNTIGVYYQIPFAKGNVVGHVSGADDAEGIEIARNHLYTVTIGDGTKVGINTKMLATLSVADWDDNTDVAGTFYSELFTGVTNNVTGVSYDKVTQHFEIPMAALADGDGVSIDVADTYWDGGAGVTIDQIQVLTDGEWTTAGTSATASWLTAEMTSNATLTAADATGKRIKISATANGTGADRNGAIRLIYKNTSAGAADQYITFTITQKGS